ncbi:hypothetical protein [Trichothermofontia sp.]
MQPSRSLLPVAYSVDSLTNSDRLPDWQTPPTDQYGWEWLGFGWGLSAINTIAHPSQGVSETWWRVFKAHHTGWPETIECI